jgi:hypothetical protein
MFRKFAVAATVAAICAVLPMTVAAEVDLSTPKAAAKTFGQGMSDGDIDQVKASVLADADQTKALEALVKVIANFKKVEEAAVAKFGEAGKTVASQQQMSVGEELAKIDQSTETIDGDNATLTAPDSQEPLHLKKTDGQWKVDFSQMPGSDQIAQALPMIDAMAGAAGELSTEIAADKYKTADEAKNALGQKMMAAMMAMQPQTMEVPDEEPADDASSDAPEMEETITEETVTEEAPDGTITEETVTEEDAVIEEPSMDAPAEAAPAE